MYIFYFLDYAKSTPCLYGTIHINACYRFFHVILELVNNKTVIYGMHPLVYVLDFSDKTHFVEFVAS